MSISLDDLFDVDLMHKHLEAGYVRRQVHPTAPLAVLNYGPMVAYEKAWDEVTSQTRGLIYNTDTLEVVARPWRKFFNWDDTQIRIPAGPLLRSPKMDGSMGILYSIPTNNGMHPFATRWQIASRGSFTSDQAMRGSQMFMPAAIRSGFAPRPGYTYLFEILFPENRIVVDYKGFKGLVLLDVIDNATGIADISLFDETRWPWKAEKELIPSFYDTMGSDIAEDEEGFVLYWPEHELRAKVKGATYLRLHRLMTGCNARTIWDCLQKGDDLSALIEDVPDEFYDFVQDTARNLREKFAEIETVSRRTFFQYVEDYGLPRPDRRKDFALFMAAHEIPYQPVMWRLWDDKPFDDLIWKGLRPEATKPFWNLSEDVA